MNETDPLAHILVVRNGSDTVAEVFLDLRPALWNKEGTLLTLWLDPGRIKRDLQPNKNFGTPLVNGQSYKLIIDRRWSSKDGAALKRSSNKSFFVGSRDDLSPVPALWNISTPAAGTKDPLKIDLSETLDYVLLKEAIDVTDSDGKAVAGEITMSDEESLLHFVPAEEWQPTSYFLRCESRLEDLAGNNLNRPFDRDITVRKTQAEKEFHKIEFNIR